MPFAAGFAIVVAAGNAVGPEPGWCAEVAAFVVVVAVGATAAGGAAACVVVVVGTCGVEVVVVEGLEWGSPAGLGPEGALGVGRLERSGSEGRGAAGRGGEEAVGSSGVVDAAARGAVAARGACGLVSGRG